ncbi:hypothetical protein [Saccharopolyspora griseoalba]|uniref:DUF5134 domain-containing protein n=1 Tax=Saccharopolyspora griseoalba TaxID=1431848 RepID=A0ABW2LBN9_9PSEU
MEMMHGAPGPEWVRLLWVVALVGVLATHLWHAWVMPGQPRWWHVGHAATAVAMIAMYSLPHVQHHELYRGGFLLFALAAVAEAGTAVLLRLREGMFNPLWLISTADKMAMTYMMSSPVVRPAVLTGALTAYLVAQAVAWALALWDRVPVLRGARAGSAREPRPGRPQFAERGSTTRGDGSEPLDFGPAPGVGMLAHFTPVTRASLAVMAASMGYMLASSVM